MLRREDVSVLALAAAAMVGAAEVVAAHTNLRGTVNLSRSARFFPSEVVSGRQSGLEIRLQSGASDPKIPLKWDPYHAELLKLTVPRRPMRNCPPV